MTTGLVDRGQREVGESFVVGPLGLGCWRFNGLSLREVIALLEAAAECGMTLLDTADVYGNPFGEVEDILGQAFAEARNLRERFVVATKGGIVPGVPYDSSAMYLRDACEASLRRLGVDVIDVYQVHRPDPFTHPGEVADALVVLHEEGKIREVGVSNYSASQLSALQAHLPLELATIQPEFSLVELGPIEDGVFDQALELGLTTFAWSPLAGGALATGDGVRPELMAVIDSLAARESCDRAAIAVAFVLSHPASPVALLGSTKVSRIHEQQAALRVSLSRPDVYALIEASRGVRLP
jgi:predicted oxidoreductase